jgi:cell wall-associated NlpC family hydrolase
MDQQTRQRAAAAALAMVGTPFAHQGRHPTAGLDCIGLGEQSYAAQGVVIDMPSDYPPDPPESLLAEGLAAVADQVEQPEAGDIVRLRLATRRRTAVHCGVMVGPRQFVHVERGGVVRRQDIDARWARRVHSYWRIR